MFDKIINYAIPTLIIFVVLLWLAGIVSFFVIGIHYALKSW